MKLQNLEITNLNNSKVVKNLAKVLLGVFILSATVHCTPDNGYTPTGSQPDGEALRERFENNRLESIQEFTLDASSGGVITGAQGTQVYFPPNVFGYNGSPVSGSVKVQLIEIYDKASILLNDKSTLGKKANGDKEILKSAGEFYIDASQGANELELLALATVNSRPVAIPDMDPDMKIFRGGDELNAVADWEQTDEDGDGENDDAKIRDGQGADGEIVTYQFDIGDFGWTNLDRWYNYAGAKTEIFVDVPEGFDGENSAVYLSYDGEPTALARMDVWNTDVDMFTEHYGLIPVGQEIHLIMVAEIDGVMHYAIQGTTVVDGHIEVIASLSPTTQANLESLINNLP